MANRIDSLICGLGSPCAVMAALCQDLKDCPEIAGDLIVLNDHFSLLMADERGRRAAYAIVAAILNVGLETSNRVYRVTASGRLDATYLSGKDELKMWASLIAD